jgi:hypothetical protein
MDEHPTDRGATGAGGKRPSGRPATRPPTGTTRPEAGTTRPRGDTGKPPADTGRPQAGSGRQPGGTGGRQGGAGRPKGGSGKPAGGSKRPAGSAKKAAARRRQERRRRAITAAVVAGVVVIAIVVVALVANRGTTNARAGYDRVTTFGGLSRNHTNSAVHYAQTPPVGGDHNPVWQNCGYYAQPIHSENAVHSMEHGAVWITYRPDLPKDQVDTLASLARGRPFVLVSPYSGLPAPVVASAWGVQEWFHTAGDSGLSQFVGTYSQGPQTPEPGAACTGGTGTPQ